MNNNKQTGEETMNESYKDKFNATMKKFGINSLDDLKSDSDKKKFFRAVDNAHDAKDEELEEGLTPAQKKLPAGLQILGRPYSEGLLIQISYAYEQNFPHRRPPIGLGLHSLANDLLN